MAIGKSADNDNETAMNFRDRLRSIVSRTELMHGAFSLLQTPHLGKDFLLILARDIADWTPESFKSTKV